MDLLDKTIDSQQVVTVKLDECVEKSKVKAYDFIKRTIDIIIGVIGFSICLPFFIIFAVLIKLDSKGPVFFKHTRVGKNGKVLKIYKFRTMKNGKTTKLRKYSKKDIIR